MKKLYLEPEIEVIKLTFTDALLTPSNPDSEESIGQGSNVTGGDIGEDPFA